MPDFLIPQENLRSGIKIAIHYSAKLITTSGKLFNEKEYQSSIPFAILAYEEGAKANWLLKHLEKEKGITQKEWQTLQHHKFKLIELEKYNLEMIDDMSEAEMEIYLNFQKEQDKEIAEKSKDDALKKRKDLLEVLAKFEKIKESCFYSDWDSGEKKWKAFGMIPKEDQYAISYAIIYLADNLLLRIIFMRDLFENPSKPKGIKRIIADTEKDRIIELYDHKEDMEKRKTVKDLKLHYEESKRNAPVIAKGLSCIRKYF
jgi:AbiV family abortive infection protein